MVGILCFVATFLQYLPLSLQGILPMFWCPKVAFLKRILVTKFRIYSDSVGLHPNLITSAKALFPSKVTCSGVLGLGLQHISSKGTSQLRTLHQLHRYPFISWLLKLCYKNVKSSKKLKIICVWLLRVSLQRSCFFFDRDKELKYGMDFGLW